MDTICLICATPLADGSVVCRRDAEPARDSLVYVLERRLLGELETATTRQVRFGPGSGGRRATDDTPMPVNLLAGDVEHRTRNTLTTWARVVMDHRGTTVEEVWPDLARIEGARCKPKGNSWCTHRSCASITAGTKPVSLERVAQFLLERIQGIRYLDQAPEILADLARLRGDIESVCDAPPKLIALGQCDGTLEDGSACGTELRARKDATLITCRYCGEPYSVQTRIAQLLRRVDALQATAPVIARVLSDWMGKPLPIDTIQKWGRPRNGNPPKLRRRGTDPATNQPLYLVGEAKALHQASIQRDLKIEANRAEKESQPA